MFVAIIKFSNSVCSHISPVKTADFSRIGSPLLFYKIFMIIYRAVCFSCGGALFILMLLTKAHCAVDDEDELY